MISPNWMDLYGPTQNWANQRAAAAQAAFAAIQNRRKNIADWWTNLFNGSLFQRPQANPKDYGFSPWSMPAPAPKPQVGGPGYENGPGQAVAPNLGAFQNQNTPNMPGFGLASQAFSPVSRASMYIPGQIGDPNFVPRNGEQYYAQFGRNVQPNPAWNGMWYASNPSPATDMLLRGTKRM